MNKILESVGDVTKELNEIEVNKFMNMIIRSDRIFLVGTGRSGLVARAFAMRLMHLGFNVYVVGETITPAIKPKDLLIAISGSGRTSSVLIVAKTAKMRGIKIVSITSFSNSPLGKISDCVIQIAGRVKPYLDDYISKQLKGMHEPLTPLGTLFEISTSVFLDSVITELMLRLGKNEEEMKKRHTNLE